MVALLSLGFASVFSVYRSSELPYVGYSGAVTDSYPWRRSLNYSGCYQPLVGTVSTPEMRRYSGAVTDSYPWRRSLHYSGYYQPLVGTVSTPEMRRYSGAVTDSYPWRRSLHYSGYYQPLVGTVSTPEMRRYSGAVTDAYPWRGSLHYSGYYQPLVDTVSTPEMRRYSGAVTDSYPWRRSLNYSGYYQPLMGKHNVGRLTANAAANVKMQSSEIEWRMMGLGVQLHDGAGCMKECPICRMFTDARINRILAGSSEIMRYIVGRDVFSQKYQSPLL